MTFDKHRGEIALAIFGLGMLFTAARHWFMGWREDPESESQIHRTLAAYGPWAKPLAYIGVAILAIDGIVFVVRTIMFG